METVCEKIFVSYSWDSKDHQEWVAYLVRRLREEGYDARYDQYITSQNTINLNRMMVERIKNDDFVIVVVTENYTKKADEFIGGVGFESELLLSVINENKDKVIVVTKQLSANKKVPFYLKGYHYLDFSNDNFETSLDDLIRRLQKIPKYDIGEIGEKKKRISKIPKFNNAVTQLSDIEIKENSFAENLVEKFNVLNYENADREIVGFEEEYLELGATYKCSTNTIELRSYLPKFPERLVGSCALEIKRNEFKDIIITLNHNDIFDLFVKIKTKSREHFFSEESNDKKYGIYLPNIRLNLLEKEVDDLLFVIDKWYSYYINDLNNITNYLEINKFDISEKSTFGIKIMKVRLKLWEYMVKFANEHDYSYGRSKWHIFQLNWSAIHVYSPVISHNPDLNSGEHAYFNIEQSENIKDDFVWIVLNLNITIMSDIKLEQFNKKNIWGALTAYNWLVNEFLPEVSMFYNIKDIHNFIEDYSIKEKLNKPKRSIISELQMFYMSNNVIISKQEIESLKEALIYCLIKKELSINEYEYILKKLGVRHFLQHDISQITTQTISYLKNNPFKISSSIVDDLLRCMLPFVDNGKSSISKDELEILITKLNPLIEKMQQIEFLRKNRILKNIN